MATRHLGNFGCPREPIDADFTWCGETIRVHPDANDLAFAELMFKAQAIDMDGVDLDDPSSWDPETAQAAAEAGNLAMDMIRQQIHPEDWDRFWKTARANRQNTIDLMALSQQITGLVANFRSGPSSVSSPGRPSTGRRSKAASSSQRVLKSLDGRPDLKMAAWQAHQARQAG